MLKVPLASSIHTIHRPVALSQRLSSSRAIRLDPTTFSPVEEEAEIRVSGSESEDDTQDFERTPQLPTPSPAHLKRSMSQAVQSTNPSSADFPQRIGPARTGSMATVRLQRRTGLARKLKEVFDLEEIEEVWAEMPCWLLRSICTFLF
jgi:sterol 3beta-glucosyltransferase